jgi:hypothetical protein
MPAISFSFELPTWQRLAKRLRTLRARRSNRRRYEREIRSLRILERSLDGEAVSYRESLTALDNLLSHFRTARCSEECLIGQKGEILDRQELDEALSRARRGQIEDCLIHLGRAMPQRFSGIADALEKALRR